MAIFFEFGGGDLLDFVQSEEGIYSENYIQREKGTGKS